MKSSSGSGFNCLDPPVVASTLLKSSEWGELVAELQQTPGGGPAIFSLAQRSLEAAILWKVGNITSTMQVLTEALKTVTWEKLHTGAWYQVQRVWRDVYALACILAASLLHQPDLQAALVQLDMALLMGGNAFRGYIHPMVDSLVSSTHSTQPQGAPWALDLKLGFPPIHPIPLPPASLETTEHLVTVKNVSNLSLMHFAASYMGKLPVVIQQALEGWPALDRWPNMQYLLSVAGLRTVPVEIGKHYLASEWRQRLMLFSDFLQLMCCDNNDKSKNNNGENNNSNGEQVHYLAQHDLLRQIPALAKDVSTPEYCVALSSRIPSVNCWFGPAGTITPLHTDRYHNFLCQVVGRKYVRLYANDQKLSLYPFKGDVMTENASMVDLDNLDPASFPLFPSTPFLEHVLEPGDMLYIPPLWWHYVKSLSSSASVSFWWESEEGKEQN
jgi:hypothetical protein